MKISGSHLHEVFSSEETSSFLHSTTTMGLLCGGHGAIKIPNWFVPCEPHSLRLGETLLGAGHTRQEFPISRSSAGERKENWERLAGESEK